MKAAQFFAARDIRIVEIPTPVPKESEALIAIEWCGICGSDLHEYLIGPAAVPTKEKPHVLTGEHLPVTIGHEFCGRIVNAPKESDFFEGLKGFHGSGGGFSELVAVETKHCYPLPESVDLGLAALIEPLAVAWHAVTLCGIKSWSDKSVLVLGGGPIGIAHISVLRAKGCRKIFVSEPTAVRATQNREIADQVFNPVTEDVAGKCRELTSGEGVDVVFDCAGVQKGLNAGMDALTFRGVYMNVAGWETTMVIPVMHLLMKEISLKASITYNDCAFKNTVDAFVAGQSSFVGHVGNANGVLGKFDGIESMVTSRIHIDNIVEKGFEELVRNKDQHIKIMVTPRKDRLGQHSRL
ncbi:hypothetical protein N0V90_004122 [Kalmusia sp. IMI 367209]|nr:hypothetical protein N0V90_004122 [Kalmusia sp. IMI 367209]